MKIVYADMSIEFAKLLLANKNRPIIELSNTFGVSALRALIKKTSFLELEDRERIFLVNCPLSVDLIVDEIKAESNGSITPFLKSFQILDKDGNLSMLYVRGVTPETVFSQLLLSGGCVAKEGF